MFEFLKKGFDYLFATRTMGVAGKDKMDKRDHLYALDKGETSLISKASKGVSLREYIPFVKNQEQISACVGFSLSYAMEILTGKVNKKMGLPSISICPYWIYWWARKIDSREYKDDGAYIRSGMKALKEIGATAKLKYAYMNPLKAPNDCKDDNYKIKEYIRILDDDNFIPSVKNILEEERLPVIVSISLYEGCTNDWTGLIKIPTNGELFLGRHAVCLTGTIYQDGKLYFEFVNSWGKTWGNGGYGIIESSHLEKLFADAWTFDKTYW